MSRSVRLALLFLTVFLVLFPLAAGRPGQPPTMKADEPAYFLMALSLVEDGDLEVGPHDIRRGFDHYPYLPLDNLILMTGDGWETVYFGKPYVYSFFAAPAAALFGVNGLPAFNMLLLMGMVWMGAFYLSKFNSGHVATLFSAGFFILSPAFAYVFWIHPEIFNMFSIAVCLYMAFHEPEEGAETEGFLGRLRARLFASSLRPVWSGAALALSVYNKPVLALLGVPALFIFFRRRGWKTALIWILAAGLSLSAVAGISVAYTGQPSAYLGVDRGGLKVLDPGQYVESIEKLRVRSAAHHDEAANSWGWIFRLPKPELGKLAEEVGYFLVGRHTGLVPYMPFAVLALLLFLLHARSSPERWVTCAALVGVAAFFLIWIPFNWHGGGGFIGNRYFINVYPAFIFLVTAIRPVWLTVAGSGVAALMLGSVLFSPWGAPVPSASLQAHVRGGLFRYFPLELSLRRRIPGYATFGHAEVGFFGRRDVFKVLSAPEGIMWIQGATRAEIWLYSFEPLEKLLFEVHSWKHDNEILIEMPGVDRLVTFEGNRDVNRNREIVELTPSRPTKVRREGNKTEYLYRMFVSPLSGRHQGGNMLNAIRKPLFYIGAQLTFIGTREFISREENNRVEWIACEAPSQMTAGSTVGLPVTVRNTSSIALTAGGPTPVVLSYHWLDEAGKAVEINGLRTRLAADVPRGADAGVEVAVQAPEAPGTYTLSLDVLRQNIAWFSHRGASTCDRSVEILPSGSE